MTGIARATTVEIGRRWVAGQVTIARTSCGRVASTVYRSGQFSLGFILQLAAPDPSLRGVLCRTCAEFL